MKFSRKKLFENTVFTFILLSIVLLLFSIVNIPRNKIDVSYNSEIDKEIEELFKKKNEAILKGDVETLETIYDLENKFGQWGYEQELKKIKYISNWNRKQGVIFKEINPKIVIKSIKEEGNKISVNLLCSNEYKYSYKDDKKTNISRVGTHHVLDLIKENEKLKIEKEWYDDPFMDSLNLDEYDGDISEFLSKQRKKNTNITNERKKAIDYANKFAGAASKEKFGFKYNSEFRNYSSEGGDCTNFISQVLLESGFEKNNTWNYIDGNGTDAWVNARAFKEFLVYNGRGVVLSSGDYNKVYKDSYKLDLGDIISYEKEGRISHTAIVTAFDSKGYPLITCHDTDRNDVPWDIGFNGNNIKFHFIKMNY